MFSRVWRASASIPSSNQGGGSHTRRANLPGEVEHGAHSNERGKGSPPSEGVWMAAGGGALALVVVAHPATTESNIAVRPPRKGRRMFRAEPVDGARVMGGQDIGRSERCQRRRGLWAGYAMP